MIKNYYNHFGVNIMTEAMLFSKIGDRRLDPKMMAIRAFTSSNLDLIDLYKKEGVKLRKLFRHKLKMIYDDDIIVFSRLSDLLAGDNSKIADIREELLDYKRRKSQCHIRSLEYIRFGNYIVTGYVDDSKACERIVHSWIETEDKVIDYTSNLVIGKDDYYRLMRVEIINVISKEDVLSDCNSDFLNSFPLSQKFYCLFRDELVKNGLIQTKNEEATKKLIR